jgi:branched-chain amino acid transport system permease protein
MSLILQTIADGLVLGGLYSLAAVGFSLIFGVMNVVNLSHGVLVLIGAYISYTLWHFLGIDPLLSIPLNMAVLFCFGYVYQRGIIQLAVDRSSLLASMLVTFGVALVLRNILVLIFSPDFKSVTPAYAFTSLSLGGITLDFVRIVALCASLVLLTVLTAVLNFTAVGRVIRATAQQEMAARLCGVDARHVYGLTFGVSAAFAGASGAILGIVVPFAPPDEAIWTINAFVVVTLGGVGSPAGALIGGLLLGLISTFTSQFIGPAFPNAMMFLILVLMLLVRPSGLLGNAFSGSR